MVMTCATGMGDAVLRERLPALWRRIEDTHYSYLETDDSPEKLQQKQKLEDYIIEYLSLVPHECKFGLAETGKVFQRTVNELPDFSAYRAGLGWAALARYAGNLLAQPWRKEYKVIRLYSGYYKHEVEANMVGAESLLHAMGYRSTGAGRLALDAPICPDMVAAVSRDALIAHCECQIMSQIWEAVWGSGARVSWSDVARERAARASSAAAAAARLAAPQPQPHPHSHPHPHPHPHPHHLQPLPPLRDARHLDLSYVDGSDIYSNVPVTVTEPPPRNRYHAVATSQCSRVCPEETSLDEPITPIMHPPYMMSSNVIPPQMMYPVPHPHMRTEVPVTVTNVPMMTPYGLPYYYPVQTPYMVPTPVYAPIKHATNVPLNGYPPIPQYRYPTVPTGQLIELDSPSVYENGKFERHRDEERGYRKSRQPDSSRRNSTSKSNFSDISLPSLPRSDTQPTLSKAREDGMGTYESWDYVFRNLSSKEQDTGDSRSRYSPSLDRDSRTLDRLDRDERRAKYQPTTLDLEDGLQAMNLDRSYDDEMYRTAKVNENLMRMKQEQELKRAKQLAKKQVDERRTRKLEPIGNPKADALIPTKVAPDKVKLLTKKDIKDRKDVIKQQNSVNGTLSSTAEVKKVKKPTKHVAVEVEKSNKSKPLENGVNNIAQNSMSNAGSSYSQANYDLKAQLIVTLDEPDSVQRSPPKSQQNGERSRPTSRASTRPERPAEKPAEGTTERKEAWECSTCTYLNKGALGACEMCGKSRRPPSIQPLTSGGRECPACTLVNRRDATRCDACGTGLDHCPTYI